MTEKEEKLWEKCAAFHGHVCGGLAIGFKAALYAAELLGLTFSEDEDVVCVSENDSCGVDAIQVILGCSVGKGNLLFHMRGKQAFSFYNRKNGKSVRLMQRPGSCKMTRQESLEYYLSCPPEEMFEAMETRIALPERAMIFDSYDCECCGENTASRWIRIQGGKKLCLDCWQNYNRFDI